MFSATANVSSAVQPPDVVTLKKLFGDLQSVTVRIDTPNDRSSGVFVSQSGHVLTVAHGLRATTHRVRLVLHDGRQVAAHVVERDEAQDLALLQVTESQRHGLPPPVTLSRDNRRQQGQFVLGAGYPSREKNGLPPVVRLGTIQRRSPGRLWSTCTLSVGDSGGPLVDLNGELVGIHRQIGKGVSEAVHTPVAGLNSILKRVPHQTGLHEGNGFSPVFAMSAEAGNTSRAVSMQLQLTVTDQDDTTSVHTISATQITSVDVVTKASHFPNATVAYSRKRGVSGNSPVTFSHQVRELDLAFWKLADTDTQFAARHTPANRDPQPGLIVYAGDAHGILTRVNYDEPPMAHQLGCRLEQHQTNALRVLQIARNSAAHDARLQVDDLLSAFDGVRVRSFVQLSDVLKRFQPGDWIQFDGSRNDSQFRRFGQLRHDPAGLLDRSEFLDGRSGDLSRRRSGFAGVLQHDIPIRPDQCGSPLIDSSGAVIGINIARRGRESTLAVPLQRVMELIQP